MPSTTMVPIPTSELGIKTRTRDVKSSGDFDFTTINVASVSSSNKFYFS